MTLNHETWQSPFVSRYVSREMLEIWSDRAKYELWRTIWCEVADVQRSLHFAISSEQIAQMRDNICNIDYERVAVLESELRHDVVAHLRAFGEAAPLARPIMHLGMTSCDVTDNADLVIMRRALKSIISRLSRVLCTLDGAAREWLHLPITGYTHLQPAQPTTLAKRVCMWASALLSDFETLMNLFENLKFRGMKGAVGTQDSFLRMFEGAADVRRFDNAVARRFGFNLVESITGQTYSRKVDHAIVSALANVAISAHKIATDIRLMQSQGQLFETFGTGQAGSSAMAQKRNPVVAERICGLSRYLMNLPTNTAQTAANQWLERTLDDSSNRRIVLPEAFLCADAVVSSLSELLESVVADKVEISACLRREFPFMVGAAIMVMMSEAGIDRQDTFDVLRIHIRNADSKSASFVRVLLADSFFAPIRHREGELKSPAQFVGVAVEQVLAFLNYELRDTLALWHVIANPMPD